MYKPLALWLGENDRTSKRQRQERMLCVHLIKAILILIHRTNDRANGVPNHKTSVHVTSRRLGGRAYSSDKNTSHLALYLAHSSSAKLLNLITTS